MICYACYLGENMKSRKRFLNVWDPQTCLDIDGNRWVHRKIQDRKTIEVVSPGDNIPIWSGCQKLIMFPGRSFYFSVMFLWIRGSYGGIDRLRKLENILNSYCDQVSTEWFMGTMMPPVCLKMWFSPAAFKSCVEKLRSQYLDFCKIAVLLAVCNRNANKEKNLRMLAREWLKWCTTEFRKIRKIENTAAGI